MNNLLKKIRFDDKGLVPAVVQEINTNKVLMLAYMNEESIKKTLDERVAYYYSRSREKLWKKGETSGNIQKVMGFYYDCDGDTILLKVEQVGVACHTGAYSCFYNKVLEEQNNSNIINDLYTVIGDRRDNPKEGSYTGYLFQKGLDKVLKKVGEEASEVIIGAKNNNKEELVYEISDLIYHLLVLMVMKDIEVEDINQELRGRRQS